MEFLTQHAFPLTAVRHCVTFLERQLEYTRIPKTQVRLEGYLFRQKVIFLAPMICLRIQAQYVQRWNSKTNAEARLDL